MPHLKYLGEFFSSFLLLKMAMLFSWANIWIYSHLPAYLSVGLMNGYYTSHKWCFMTNLCSLLNVLFDKQKYCKLLYDMLWYAVLLHPSRLPEIWQFDTWINLISITTLLWHSASENALHHSSLLSLQHGSQLFSPSEFENCRRNNVNGVFQYAIMQYGRSCHLY